MTIQYLIDNKPPHPFRQTFPLMTNNYIMKNYNGNSFLLDKRITFLYTIYMFCNLISKFCVTDLLCLVRKSKVGELKEPPIIRKNQVKGHKPGKKKCNHV